MAQRKNEKKGKEKGKKIKTKREKQKNEKKDICYDFDIIYLPIYL